MIGKLVTDGIDRRASFGPIEGSQWRVTANTKTIV